MMEKSQKYLSDILRCIALVENFTSGISIFEAYQLDLKAQSAVDRQLSILGEALNNFRKLEPKIEIENSRNIVSFRNRLVHAYDSVDNTII